MRAAEMITVSTMLSAVFGIDSATALTQQPKYEMGTFYVCLLIRNPDFKGGATEIQQLREGHLKHMQSLIAAGKALVSGPFIDNNRIVGVVVFNASSAEEARAFEDPDPFVKSGFLSV